VFVGKSNRYAPPLPPLVSFPLVSFGDAIVNNLERHLMKNAALALDVTLKSGFLRLAVVRIPST